MRSSRASSAATPRRSSPRCRRSSSPPWTRRTADRKGAGLRLRPLPLEPRGGGMNRGIRGREALYGWAFVAPAILIIGVFLAVPILLALWVSFSNWNGLGSPLANSDFVGGENYAALVTEPGLAQSDFGTSLRNNLYYVLLVVP